jgi:hypothetical protein
MAQAVSRWPVTAEAQVHARVFLCGICDGLSALGLIFLLVLLFSLSVPFHYGSPCSYIISGMNNRPVGFQQFRDTASPHRHVQFTDNHEADFSLVE